MARAHDPNAVRSSFAGLLIAPLLPTLCACAPAAIRDPTPALLTHPTEKNQIELSRVVGEALGRPPVLLAPDALTRESSLTIEPVRPRDPNGLPLDGRALGHSEHFRLVKEGARCVLIQERTGIRWTLSQPCARSRAPNR